MIIHHGHARIVRDGEQWRAEVDLAGDHPSALGADPLCAAMNLLQKIALTARSNRGES